MCTITLTLEARKQTRTQKEQLCESTAQIKVLFLSCINVTVASEMEKLGQFRNTSDQHFQRQKKKQTLLATMQ